MAATEQVTILLKAKDEASKVINGVSDNVNGLAKVAGTALKVAGAAAVAAVGSVTAAVGVGVKKAADMEQQVADIASVMGITFKEAKPLKDLITKLGVDPKLKVSATEAADAIQMLARNGLKMDEILNGAARSTVLLANATNADFGTAANIATDVMAQFNISAENMAAAVNGITSVTTNSKFDINDYGLALAQAGGIASSVGVDFDDFNTTIAAISPLFASGSDAGTSFKTFLQRLIPASNDAEAAMKALGLITEDGKNQFFDAAGNMKSMDEIAGLLQTALGGLSEEQKNAALATIFGTDAMRAAVGLAETGKDGFNELAGSMAKVDAEATAATRMDTFSGTLEILQGIIDGLLTQIGDAFLPILRDLAQWAIDFADTHGPAVVTWFENLAEWFKDQEPIIKTWTEKVFGALNEVLAWLRGEKTDFTNLTTIWNGIATMIGGVVQAAIKFVTDNTPKWIAALMGWATLAASWAKSLWDVYVWPGLVQFWTNMSSWLVDPAKRQVIINVLMDWWNQFKSWATNLWAGTLQPGLAQVWANIKTWLDTNAAGLGTAMDEWLAETMGFINGMLGGWGEAWPNIQTIVGDAQERIGESVDRIMASLDRISKWFGEDETDVAEQKFITWAQFFEGMALTLTMLVDLVVTSAEMIVTSFEAIGTAIRSVGTGDWAGLTNAGEMIRSVTEMMADFMARGTLAANAIAGRARGGPVQAGVPYWVGELGPELFVPERSGTIVPNTTTNTTNNTYNVNMMGSGNAGNDVLSSLRLVSAMYG